jgi:hypothetical protein
VFFWGWGIETVALGDAVVCMVLLGLKPSNACDAIGAVTEFMVDVARVEARPFVWRHQCDGRVHGWCC